ncbi:MAG: response regulator transcription factor [Pseudomonadota bacterium]
MTEPASPDQPHKVLIVDDQVLTAEHLAKGVALRDDLQLIGMGFTLEEGLKLLTEHQPRIVLVDLGLPDGSGMDILRAISKVTWPCDALVVSVFGDEKSLVTAIRAGARGYILKSSGIDHIGQQIATLIAGGSPMSPVIARRVLSLVAEGDVAQTTQEQTVEILTAREHEILTLIARGYKRAEIASMLSIAIGTVGNHINNVYRKLEVRSNTEAVSKATKIGVL